MVFLASKDKKKKIFFSHSLPHGFRCMLQETENRGSWGDIDTEIHDENKHQALPEPKTR